MESGESWTRRLAFDLEVSVESPVVRGTWVTVDHVVSMIVDGCSWADILRSHPELTEDDVRACVGYAVAEDMDEYPKPSDRLRGELGGISPMRDGRRTTFDDLEVQ